MAIFERTAKLKNAVSIELDGKTIEAERGEPLAVALVAASRLVLARSPKLHRPRGPSCLRGDCDGCLARVDGVPNVMLCLKPAAGGERIETQNVLGTSDTDLLRVTDWFFPKGIDHHHLMTGIPGVHAVMQSFARKLAGIGRLPEEGRAPLPSKRESCDVLVVGAGPSGTSVAAALSERGLDVVLVDDGTEPGGSGRFADDETRRQLDELSLARVRIELRATVAGIYETEALVVREEGALVLKPKVIVLATGAHDGVLAVDNNDLPGIMSARALAALHRYGLTPRAPIALVGDGYWLERCASLFGDQVATRLGVDQLASFDGTSRVKSLRDKDGKKTSVELVAIGAPGAPSFELAEMAGAEVAFGPAGYQVVTDGSGRAGKNVFAVGECTGEAFEPRALIASATKVAGMIATSSLTLRPA